MSPGGPDERRRRLAARVGDGPVHGKAPRARSTGSGEARPQVPVESPHAVRVAMHGYALAGRPTLVAVLTNVHPPRAEALAAQDLEVHVRRVPVAAGKNGADAVVPLGV